MSKAKYLLLSLFLVFNIYANQRIVGGEEVENINEAPFIVKLKGCAASIISSRWLLTAAHCESIFEKGITGGSLDVKAQVDLPQVEKSFVHPNYFPELASHDFALIKLKTAIKLDGESLKAIKIADKNHVAQGFQSPGTVATVYGWGKTGEGWFDPSSQFLRKVEVPIVSNETANASGSYNGAVDESMIAAGFDEGKKDACQGDSGGPLVSQGANGEAVLIGVVSWGHGCARAKKYGIYSKVSYAYDWIIKTVHDNSN